MNPSLASSMWFELPAILALETLVICGLAAGLTALITRLHWRRLILQTALASLALVALGEITGINRGLTLLSRPSGNESSPAQPTPRIQSNRSEIPMPSAQSSSPNLPGKGSTSFLTPEILMSVTPDHSTAGSGSGVAVAHTPFPNRFGVDWKPENSPAVTAEEATVTPAPDNTAPAAIDWIPWLWGFGSAILLVRMLCTTALCGFFRFRSRIAISDQRQLEVQILAHRLGFRRSVWVFESTALTSPIAFGWIRPTIGLPADFSRQFTRTQQEAVIAHELAHLTAGDPIWYKLADLLSALLWWHPAVWWIRRRYYALSELAADEACTLIADGPQALAECLIAFGRRLQPRPASGFLNMAGRFRSQLGRRISRLQTLSPGSMPRPMRFSARLFRPAGMTLLIGACLVSTVGFQSPPKPQKGDPNMNIIQQSWQQSLGAVLLAAALGSDPAHAAEANQPESPADPPRSQPAAAASTTQGSSEEGNNADSSNSRILPTSPESQAQQPPTSQPPEPDSSTPPPPPAPQSQSVTRAVSPAPPPAPYGRESRYRQSNPYEAGAARGRYGQVQSPEMQQKLGRIKFDEIHFPSLPLSEVVRFLIEETRTLDPEGKGVNFILDRSAAHSHVPEDVPSIEDITVNIDPPLRDIRLSNLLDLICRSSNFPISYSIEDYGVILSPNYQFAKRASDPQGSVRLVATTYRINTMDLLQGAESAFGIDTGDLIDQLRHQDGRIDSAMYQEYMERYGLSGPNGPPAQPKPAQPEPNSSQNRIEQSRSIQKMLKEMFTKLGVDMTHSDKAVFYNDRTGVMFVRATPEDLQIIQAAIQTLSGSPPAGPGSNFGPQPGGFGGFGGSGFGGGGPGFGGGSEFGSRYEDPVGGGGRYVSQNPPKSEPGPSSGTNRRNRR